MEKAEGFCAPSWCFTFEKHRGFSNIVSTPVLFWQITFTKGDVINIEIIIYITILYYVYYSNIYYVYSIIEIMQQFVNTGLKLTFISIESFSFL